MEPEEEGVRLGLCSRCRFARRVRSAKGALFLRCGRSDADASYARYPRLPMVKCRGFTPAGPEEGD